MMALQARCKNDCECSEPFLMSDFRDKQYCVLGPKQFSMSFSAMLMDALQGCDAGVTISTALMASYLTYRGYKQNVRCNQKC